MKNVEERLRQLPAIAEECGVQADARLQYRIRNAARTRQNARAKAVRRLVPVLACVLVLAIGISVAVPSLTGPADDVSPLTAQAAGDGSTQAQKRSALLDVPQGSLSITTGAVPEYSSIWAKGSGANFPLIGVDGRYYRMLTTPGNVSQSLLGDVIGTVAVFTDEPSLAGKNGVVSNVVAQGENVYAISGMNGAMAAAYVDGSLRVFQRVGYADSALVGNESIRDTLLAGNVISLELSGVGSILDGGKAADVLSALYNNAFFQRAGGGETDRSLLIRLSNGLTLQLMVDGEMLIGCGTWACPEFFEAFEAALAE